MIIISSNTARLKTATLGTSIPGTLVHPFDRPDPYKLYRGPNSGEGYKHTTPMSQGVAGSPPDMAADFGLFQTMHDDSYAELADGDWDHGDPDHPFNGRQRTEGLTEYGEGLSDMSWSDPASPTSRNRRVFEISNKGANFEKRLNQKRKLT